MRFFCVLPALGLLFGARASSLDSRAPAPHSLDVRDTPDTCASLDTLLIVLDFVGPIDTCLCVSGISNFLETDDVGETAVGLAGEPLVAAALASMIDSAASQENCNYPDNSTPVCDNGNPCGFECIDGFTPHPPGNPTTCECKPPNVICNGVCGSSNSCPSSQPQGESRKKKRWVGSGSCMEMGPGWTACGVFGGSPRAWECVHTARDLESCGGCTLPLTSKSPVGTDCSTLPGVADVECLSGECVVRRCLKGYLPARNGRSCIPKHPTFSQTEDDIGFAPASAFGLGYVPLRN
ncbi:hypothetical protein BC827DRAFT_1341618 [Russula dissimulans]|nr:hypothetical protein BC827DRAFT_1341618 [Russula dissimulans]